jgi:hypothetical protein
VNYLPSWFAAIPNQPEEKEDYISNFSFDLFDKNDPAIEGSSLTIY